jgi:hypothetical protein
VEPLCKTVELEKAAISLRRRGCLEHLVRGRRTPPQSAAAGREASRRHTNSTWPTPFHVERLRPVGRGLRGAVTTGRTRFHVEQLWRPEIRGDVCSGHPILVRGGVLGGPF